MNDPSARLIGDMINLFADKNLVDVKFALNYIQGEIEGFSQINADNIHLFLNKLQSQALECEKNPSEYIENWISNFNREIISRVLPSA